MKLIATYDSSGNRVSLIEPDLDTAQEAKIIEIKSEAAARILELEGADGWRLRRAAQRFAMGEETEQGSLYAAIEAVRQRSDALEAEITAMVSALQVAQFDVVAAFNAV